MQRWLLLVLLLLVAGCGIPKGKAPPRLDIRYISGNQVIVGDRSVPLAELPAALKAEGATSRTEIAVSVPADASQTAMAAIGSKLATAGFRRIVFMRPRHASASVDDRRTPSPRKKLK